jgi:putative DNA primase/helicase
VKPIYWKNIPWELTRLRHWVVWKHGKVPYVAGTYRRASVTDPSAWRSFGLALDTVRCGNADGIGFVFTDTPFAGIDLDHCLRQGRLTSQVARIVAQLSSYTEISPSGSGLHVIVRGHLPPGARRKGDVEMYDTNRYLTMTGHIWRNFRIIERRQAELERLHAHLFGRPEPSHRPRASPFTPESDQELLRRAARARNAGKFARLWEGDCSDYDSPSEADLALCNFLAFWTNGDVIRMDRLFRQSGLFRPKWDEKHYASGQTYGQGTLERALAERSEDYQATMNVEPPRDACSPTKQTNQPYTRLSPSGAGKENRK